MPIKVLLVDDSLVIRSALKKLLQHDSDIEVVGMASNGQMGVEFAERYKPDITILDVEMPVMDGLTAISKILDVSPDTKIIMFSTLTEKGAEITMKALTAGATECLAKPNAQQCVDSTDEFRDHLLRLVHSISGHSAEKSLTASAPATDMAATPTPAKPASKPIVLNNDPLMYKGLPSLLAIGSSTGGPNALFEVLKHLKDISIPVVITQHMPPTFTKILAQHITDNTGLAASEGEEGMALQPGHAYVAPGGYHMRFEKKGVDTLIRLNQEPPINFCRPSVDPMMQSAIDIYGNRVLGVILTGMGNDGIGGGKALAEKNGMLIAQDEASSTVYGMPKAVADAGYCHKILPLTEIGPWLKKQAGA